MHAQGDAEDIRWLVRPLPLLLEAKHGGVRTQIWPGFHSRGIQQPRSAAHLKVFRLLSRTAMVAGRGAR